ncbi:hypothetical protein [Clostridium saccharoperbutylacetonicum]|nr:hypothetical protein [Clostridium saccharoperbutylacetonicum]AQR93357.1 hypothetical protein CLSAP_06550 [Clostridium saccharoperbutylacetonicum]AQR93366.1 hypothetical protein CLSAP_06640 [Clostridium saccharoperbutylacetonicum]NSB29063.1 hypothetical protein [Clostridium saccharoperbutylacetonicum]NSB34788.1 hypothetical protein [Clostridium saccharoperbutylacetonicum]
MTDLICGILDFIGNLLNSLLPNFSGNTGISQISEAIVFFVKLISVGNYLFPVDTLFEVIGILVSYKIFMFGLWLFSYVFNLIVKIVRG